MKKIFLGFLIVFILPLIVIMVSLLFVKKTTVNPEIFSVFRKIENDCLLYAEKEIVNKERYERCKKLIDAKNDLDYTCRNYPDNCMSAKDYYNLLKRFGFELPPFEEHK